MSRFISSCVKHGFACALGTGIARAAAAMVAIANDGTRHEACLMVTSVVVDSPLRAALREEFGQA
jgi:hypothetical protein